MTEKRPRQTRTNLTMADLGNAAFVKTIEPGLLAKSGGQYFIGHLIGKVSSIIRRTDKKEGTEYEGLSGLFMLIPADTTKPEIESEMLFISDTAHNLVTAKFNTMVSKDKGAVTEFGFSLASVVDKSPRGYSWKFTPMFDFRERYLLDDMLASLSNPTKPQAKK